MFCEHFEFNFINLRKFLPFLENPEIQIGGHYYYKWRHKMAAKINRKTVSTGLSI